MISPLFTTIVLVAGFIWIYMKVTTKSVGKSTEELIEKELKANSVRRQPLTDLNYIHFTRSSIPVIDPSVSPEIGKLLSTLDTLYDKNIVDLTGITNTDLKLAYGPANLPDLTQFDENFDLLLRTLNDLGIRLYECSHKEEAAKVLEYAVSIGTDYSSSFLMLADICLEYGRYEDIQKLVLRAGSMHSLAKDATVNKLKMILETRTPIAVSVSEPVPETEDLTVRSVPKPSSDSEIFPDNILPKDILDILDSEPYKDHDQK